MSRAADVQEARNLIREVFPTNSHGSVKAACYAAYRALKLATVRRAETIWQGAAKRIDPWELDALRYEKAKQDDLKTINDLKRTATTLAQIDPTHYRATIDEIRSLADQIGLRGAEGAE